MPKRIDDVKREEWRKRLGKYDRVGLTVAEFCRREQVSEASFYYWSKRVSRGKSEAPERAQRKAAVAMPADEASQDFVEVIVGDSIRVRMPTGRLGAVATLVRELQAVSVDDAMTTSRFHRIQLDPPTQS